MASPVSSNAVSSTSTSSAAPASTSASFVFAQIPEMYTCGLATVRWTYVGNPGPLTLNISNVNVPQQAPLSSSTTSSSTSAASPSASAGSTSAGAAPVVMRRQFNGYGGSYLPSVNTILIAGIDPTAGNWTWNGNGVDVPQGWYQMLAYVQGALHTSSSSFFVQNGTNTNCVPQYVNGSPSTQSPLSTSTSTSPSAIVATPSSHSHVGAIAGGVVGGVAFLAAAIVAFLYLCVRRREARSRRSGGGGGRGGRRWSELSFRKLRRGSDGTVSLRKNQPGLEPEQTFVGSDEEISALGHEKVVAAVAANQPSSVLPRSGYTPSPRGSTQSNNRTTSNQGAPPVRRASYSYRPSTAEAIPLERTNTTGGGSRRKPAPRYEGDDVAVAAERDGHSSSRTTLDAAHANPPHSNGATSSDHVLKHQSSFGAMRPMHVMMADPPAPAHS